MKEMDQDWKVCEKLNGGEHRAQFHKYHLNSMWRTTKVGSRQNQTCIRYFPCTHVQTRIILCIILSVCVATTHNLHMVRPNFSEKTSFISTFKGGEGDLQSRSWLSKLVWKWELYYGLLSCEVYKISVKYSDKKGQHTGFCFGSQHWRSIHHLPWIQANEKKPQLFASSFSCISQTIQSLHSIWSDLSKKI